MTEFYKSYRPTSLDEIYGQPEAVEMLSEMLENGRVPQTLLLAGPSGVGKTTIARILRTELKCLDFDYLEQNCAEARGIDTVREIQQKIEYMPIGGSRCIVLDEVHKLTNDSQNCLLKTLEDTPPDVYFFLCTTDPKKVLETVRNRSTIITLKEIDEETLDELMTGIIESEKLKHITEKSVQLIARVAAGSARRALVILNQIAGIKDAAEQLKVIGQADVERVSKTVAQLIFAKGTTWKDMATVLRTVEASDIESIRHGVLGYAAAILLSSGMPKAADVMVEFERPFYDSGKPGLILCCYRIIGAK